MTNMLLVTVCKLLVLNSIYIKFSTRNHWLNETIGVWPLVSPYGLRPTLLYVTDTVLGQIIRNVI